MVTALLVRHADVDPPAGLGVGDPGLNAAGRARAVTLARIVGVAGITAVFTSRFGRTKQTVAPLAAELGLVPEEAPEPSRLADRLLSGAAGPVVLIAGHSNTVPEMIAALGAGGLPPAIGHREFDSLFVLVTVGPGQAALVRLKYGEPSL
jgi:phosphohistidine phosphatase SixA